MAEVEYVSTEEYKKCLVTLMKRIHDVCVENDVRYSVGFGTLIGAIRHHGFIPWDDDIDIFMPREDYEIFRKAFPDQSGRYYVLDNQNTPNYYNDFFRACDRSILLKQKGMVTVPGLNAYVDVFIWDRWPTDPDEQEAFRAELRVADRNLRYALPWKLYRTAPIRTKARVTVKHPLIRIKNRVFEGMKKRQEEKYRLAQKYNGTETGLRNNSCGNPHKKLNWKISEEDMGKRILVPFEDIQVYVPECYDSLLRGVYGDYMTPPPEDKRVPRHQYYFPYRNREQK